MIYIFYAFALITVAAAAGIVFVKNMLHAAFLLMISFIGVAALFIFAGADFLAVAQVMVYIGGILVLILFGIMLTRRDGSQGSEASNFKFSYMSLFLGVGLFLLLGKVIGKTGFEAMPWIQAARKDNVLVLHSSLETLGVNFMTHYLFPFELVGILLLITLIGASFIAGKVK